MIQIYGSPRSSAGRVYWMCEELNLPYKHVPMDMGSLTILQKNTTAPLLEKRWKKKRSCNNGAIGPFLIYKSPQLIG
jgi:glutathione S-transferase